MSERRKREALRTVYNQGGEQEGLVNFVDPEVLPGDVLNALDKAVIQYEEYASAIQKLGKQSQSFLIPLQMQQVFLDHLVPYLKQEIRDPIVHKDKDKAIDYKTGLDQLFDHLMKIFDLKEYYQDGMGCRGIPQPHITRTKHLLFHHFNHALQGSTPPSSEDLPAFAAFQDLIRAQLETQQEIDNQNKRDLEEFQRERDPTIHDHGGLYDALQAGSTYKANKILKWIQRGTFLLDQGVPAPYPTRAWANLWRFMGMPVKLASGSSETE